ncbi:MAG: histidine phosphatase family protein [Ruminococcaceae bacterium]|nr:histidine phosphatase family protein [Oscillospiraceae bacterium]
MTKLIIVRHGESEANEKGVVAGHNDYKLSALGLEQARQTADHLAGERIDLVCSSDLTRAVQTAEPVAKARGLQVMTYPELRETYCGRWEGVTFEYLQTKEADAYASFRDDYMYFTLPEGENIWESGVRFYNKVKELADANPDKTIFIAAHGAVIRVFWVLCCGTPREIAGEKHPYPSNASYSVVEYKDGKMLPVEFSHDSHLTVATHLHI